MDNQRNIQVAERGGIYEFIEKDGSTKNITLVVSSNKRKTDKRVSTVMLGDNNIGSDVVTVEVGGRFKYIHCGMISYSMRNRLGNKLGQLSEDKMKEIDRCILEQFGLSYVLDAAIRYEKMYQDLVRDSSNVLRSILDSTNNLDKNVSDKDNW